MVQWDAADYARHSQAQQQWARELLGKLALTGNERVLDIGCGDGKVTAEIARLVPSGSVLGVDASPEMISFAIAAHATVGGASNLSFAQADARSLPFIDEFDVIFSNATLHWVIDHRPVLAGIARSLRPGGRILLQMGGKGNAASVAKVVSRVCAQPEWAGFFRSFSSAWGFYGPDEYRVWLAVAGLSARRVELIPRTMRQPGRDGLLSWLRTTWLPFTQRVPDELHEKFLSQCADAYLQDHPLATDGTVCVEMARLEVEAVKPTVSAAR